MKVLEASAGSEEALVVGQHSVLADLAEAGLRTADSQKLMKRAVMDVCRLTAADFAAVLRLRGDGSGLEPIAMSGARGAVDADSIVPLERTPEGAALRRREAMLFADLESGEFELSQIVRSQGMRCGIATSVGEHHSPYGVLGLYAREAGALSRWDREFARLVAGLLGHMLRRNEQEARLREQARRDPLTGLANRAALTQILRERITAGADADALVLVDLDGFRRVNRSHGIRAGDSVLQAAAGVVARAAGGAPVGRLGGDEFGIVADGIDAARELARRLSTQLAAVQAAGRTYELGVSIGIARVGVARDADSLVSYADAAVREAKREGGGCTVVFDETLASVLRERSALERDLQDAIHGDDVWVAYQPVVDLQDLSLQGFEALARWDRRGEAVPPGKFVEIAERSDLIHALGARVADDALGQLAMWRHDRSQGDLWMAVNVSARQLLTPEFPRYVREVLDRAGVPATALHAEVTETALIEDIERTVETLRELKAMGVRVALDDYGTGYSSLSHVLSLEFDALKLDRSFVERLEGDRRSRAVVRAIAGTSADLGTVVIAEGVETEAQRDLLREMGIHWAQGYLFGRPAPASGTSALLAGR